jgi:signal-transduction protein with cAMP-binding, CBS, and nucleotidyltransferase domain
MNRAIDLLEEKRRELLVVPANTTVFEALRVMVAHNIGAIVAEEDGRIAGIWTERDLMRNTLDKGFDPQRARIGDYMTRDLYTAPHDISIDKLTEMYLGLFVRHIFIEKDGQKIGLLSIGDILRAGLIEKDQRIRELNQIASWDYYEDWKWEKKSR